MGYFGKPDRVSKTRRGENSPLPRRVRFDLRLDDIQLPVPPLAEADAAWAQELMTARGLGQ